jgi:hypothetical protein
VYTHTHKMSEYRPYADWHPISHTPILSLSLYAGSSQRSMSTRRLLLRCLPDLHYCQTLTQRNVSASTQPTNSKKNAGQRRNRERPTRWKTLLQLLRLLWVIEGQCVEVPRAANFEFRLLFAVWCFGCDFLYAGLLIHRTEGVQRNDRDG